MLLRRIDFDHQQPVASLDGAVEAGSEIFAARPSAINLLCDLH
jgi:hypothetical protein